MRAERWAYIGIVADLLNDIFVKMSRIAKELSGDIISVL